MHPTSYLDVNALRGRLLFQMQQVFGANLVGLYLYGSLVTGTSTPDCSDIDLLAVTASDVDEQEFTGLQEYAAVARVHKSGRAASSGLSHNGVESCSEVRRSPDLW